ncbi:fluoride efflux transporter CrcB [Salibacterium sp. K-3]
MTVFCLAAGGALGAVCRYLLGQYFTRFQKQVPFPISMLLVNIIGSLGLGLFFGLRYQGVLEGAYTDPWYLFAGIGFFGAFTTFSTFSMEAFQLLEQRKYRALFSYTGVSTAGAFLCFILGWWIGG